MKKIFLIGLIITSCVYPQDVFINTLDQSRIITKQKQIQKQLASHAKIRTALIAGGLLMTSLSVFKMVSELFKVTEIIHTTAAVQEQKTWDQKVSSFARGFVIFCAETGGAIVVNTILNKLIGDVMHEESLTWFITQQEPIIQTIELMEEIARQGNQQRLIKVTNQLMRQLESVIAFMQYKTQQNDRALLKEEIILTMQDHIHDFVRALHGSLDDASAICALVVQFKTTLNRDLIRFSYVDQTMP